MVGGKGAETTKDKGSVVQEAHCGMERPFGVWPTVWLAPRNETVRLPFYTSRRCKATRNRVGSPSIERPACGFQGRRGKQDREVRALTGALMAGVLTRTLRCAASSLSRGYQADGACCQELPTCRSSSCMNQVYGSCST